MSLSNLTSLYKQVILDHANQPHHKGKLKKATNGATLQNPSCGDLIQLKINLQNDKIKDIGFTGSGCTISQASASMMTDAVLGKNRDQALLMAQTFSDMIIGKKHPKKDLDQLKDATILSNIMKFPTRIKCATLAWWALKDTLKNKGLS